MKMKKQLLFDNKKLLNCFESFNKLVNSISNEEARLPLQNLMEDLGERFFEAPASGKLAFHNCMPGGLCEHSLRVYSIFKNLVKSYGDSNWDEDDILIAGLFHDLGKVGTLDKPYFVPKNSQWHLEKMGMVYESNPELPFMPHAQRSLFLLQHYNVKLNDLVYGAILIHDGQYVDENKPYKMNEGKFAILLHMADRLACEIEKEKWLAIQ